MNIDLLMLSQMSAQMKIQNNYSGKILFKISSVNDRMQNTVVIIMLRLDYHRLFRFAIILLYGTDNESDKFHNMCYYCLLHSVKY